MELNLALGMSYKVHETVKVENIASTYGSGGLPVFSTPHMIAIMEKAAMHAVLEHLPENYATVGTLVNIEHLSASTMGMNITAEATLSKIEGRILTFDVLAKDDVGIIGKGTHCRAIIDVGRFMDKLSKKVGN